MLLLRSNLLVDSAQAQLCSACQSFAMAHISATLIFRIKVQNKQFEAKQTSWMLTESITRALQTRIPILGSETRCARHYLACLVTLVLGLRLRLAPRKHYFVMLLKLVGSVYRRWEVCPQFSPYVFYQSHNLVCLISDFWETEGSYTCSGNSASVHSSDLCCPHSRHCVVPVL